MERVPVDGCGAAALSGAADAAADTGAELDAVVCSGAGVVGGLAFALAGDGVLVGVFARVGPLVADEAGAGVLVGVFARVGPLVTDEAVLVGAGVLVGVFARVGPLVADEAVLVGAGVLVRVAGPAGFTGANAPVDGGAVAAGFANAAGDIFIFGIDAPGAGAVDGALGAGPAPGDVDAFATTSLPTASGSPGGLLRAGLLTADLPAAALSAAVLSAAALSAAVLSAAVLSGGLGSLIGSPR